MTYLRLTWNNSMTDEQDEVVLAMPITIGRSSNNDVVIDRGFVSRNHARLSQLGDRIVVTDLGSRNGINVDNNRISEASLSNGDSFDIGSVTFTCMIQVKCTNDQCNRFVDSNRKTCPWCGQFLADAYTHLH